MNLNSEDLLKVVKEHEKEMITELSHLVTHSSYTYAPDSVNRLQDYLADQFRKEGCKVEVLSPNNVIYGSHLRIECGVGKEQMLLLAHVDTVYPEDTVAKSEFSIDDERLVGPGVYDMKGGVLQILWAVRLLKRLNLKTKYRIVLIINSDSEAGGVSSRRYIENEAIKSKAVFVLESSAAPSGELKNQHCGTGRYRLKISGASGHPSQYSPTTSAIQELSFQIQRLHSLSQPENRLVVNVGQVWGGDTVNTISPHATALIEMRFLDQEDGYRTEALILNAQPFTNCSVEINGDITRLPVRRNADTQRLMCMVRHLAEPLGLKFKDGVIGEASDGNYAATLGVPTLDGLGPVGGGAHSEQEYITRESLLQRTALLMRILCNTDL